MDQLVSLIGNHQQLPFHYTTASGTKRDRFLAIAQTSSAADALASVQRCGSIIAARLMFVSRALAGHHAALDIMDRNQGLLRHFLAAIAYRTAKALRDAPIGYESFQAGHQARTPHQLVRHMSGVINYAIGLVSAPRAVLVDHATYAAEVERFFALLRELTTLIRAKADFDDSTAERLLQGPLADAMAHAGQLALLRRLSGSPIPPEDFFVAAIDPERLGLDQADARSPDAEWPEAPDGWVAPAGSSEASSVKPVRKV